MGFNSAFKGFEIVNTPGNGRLNNLNDPVLNVLSYTNKKWRSAEKGWSSHLGFGRI